MSPHSKPKGLSELMQARSERERAAQSRGTPETPYKNNWEKRKIHKKYLSSEMVCYPHNSTDRSVNNFIALICIAAPSAKRLDEVIW